MRLFSESLNVNEISRERTDEILEFINDKSSYIIQLKEDLENLSNEMENFADDTLDYDQIDESIVLLQKSVKSISDLSDDLESIRNNVNDYVSNGRVSIHK